MSTAASAEEHFVSLPPLEDPVEAWQSGALPLAVLRRARERQARYRTSDWPNDSPAVAPLVFPGFDDAAQNLPFSIRVKRQNLLELRTSIHHEIKQMFDARG